MAENSNIDRSLERRLVAAIGMSIEIREQVRLSIDQGRYQVLISRLLCEGNLKYFTFDGAAWKSTAAS